MAEGDTVKEPQRADRLVQRRPRNAGRDQMDLEGAHVLQAQPIGRAAKIATELRNGMQVGSLGRRRQITDGHVLDHAPAKRAHLSHRGAPVSKIGPCNRNPLRQERFTLSADPLPRQRVRSIPKAIQAG